MSLFDTLLERVGKSIDFESDLCLVTFLNPYSYMVSRGCNDLFQRFSVLHPDGALLALVLKIAGSSAKRVSFDMTSLAPVVFERCVRDGLSVGVVGGAPGVAEAAVECFRSRFGAGLNFVVVRDGFFSTKNDRDEALESIKRIGPRVVIVGMGTPLQERFLVDLVDSGWSGIGFTCGGFLHQTAFKGARYYPSWINTLNLRWLYRMFDEPKLVKRYFTYYPAFLWQFAVDYFSSRLEKRSKSGQK